MNSNYEQSYQQDECVGKVALFGKLWLQRWLVGLANVCNVGGVSFFFLRGEEKNKINSSKFAPTYQRAKII